MTEVIVDDDRTIATRRARIGIVGSGYASRHFLRALAASSVASVTTVCATADGSSPGINALAPNADVCRDFDALLESGVDGIIIATPTALHVSQAEAALAKGIAVFCQRPLGRDGNETRRVIDAARNANVLLGVDMTFRLSEAMRVLRSTVQAGELGDIYAVDAIFHNAGGPDNAWARDVAQSGGGCVMDGGMCMVDLALWTLGFPRVTQVTSRLFARGERLAGSDARATTDRTVTALALRSDAAATATATVPRNAEDFATALLDLDTGATIHLACSWDLSAGEDAVIEVTFYGTEGGGTFRNVNGSRYDFTSELFQGTHRHALAMYPDDWAGRTAVSWATALARGGRYDPWVEGVADVASAVDRVLGK